jgi:hypothetical protein
MANGHYVYIWGPIFISVLAKGKNRIIGAGDMNYSSGSRCGDATSAFGRKRSRRCGDAIRAFGRKRQCQLELRKPMHHI